MAYAIDELLHRLNMIYAMDELKNSHVGIRYEQTFTQPQDGMRYGRIQTQAQVCDAIMVLHMLVEQHKLGRFDVGWCFTGALCLPGPCC
ncbi:hypothetical protein DPMN_077280 [Dreissena polymorpha]|uniref:Uncharacterized protein n=1 Tax=Dreissena polymorpha TaxID=45954 RepID=A0A9D3YK70_DREPO|nr:hypothetical protein DPMN_077280 [Dreissena polymorpha]